MTLHLSIMLWLPLAFGVLGLALPAAPPPGSRCSAPR